MAPSEANAAHGRGWREGTDLHHAVVNRPHAGQGRQRGQESTAHAYRDHLAQSFNAGRLELLALIG